MGKLLKFERPAPPEDPTVVEADQAVKQISKLFTKEELAEIKEDLQKLNQDESKK